MRVGILGDSPWVRPLVDAGRSEGVEIAWLAPETAGRVEGVARRLEAPVDDRAALDALVAWSYLVTFDPAEAPSGPVAYVAQRMPVFPRERAREVVADPRATAAFVRRVEGAWRRADRRPAAPLVRSGSRRAIPGAPTRRLSIVGVRGRRGALAFYPVAEEVIEDGLSMTLAPAPDIDEETRGTIRWFAKKIIVRLDHAGTLTATFSLHDGRLALEAIVPWVSTAGFWTVEGARPSQFESQLRSICGWPPGTIEAVRPCVTVELLDLLPDAATIRSIPGARLHPLRDRSSDAFARAKRPVGFVSLVGDELPTLRERGAELTRRLSSGVVAG